MEDPIKVLSSWIFFSQILFLIPLYMAVISYCYYEKLRRTIGTAIVSYLLKYCYSFSAAELNNTESEDEVLVWNFDTKRVITAITMMKIFNNCISGRLNNNYFLLNGSFSLYYSVNAWRNTYPKNYSKTFNALILTS